MTFNRIPVLLQVWLPTSLLQRNAMAVAVAVPDTADDDSTDFW
jgi:hypothetical protein